MFMCTHTERPIYPMYKGKIDAGVGYKCGLILWVVGCKMFECRVYSIYIILYYVCADL